MAVNQTRITQLEKDHRIHVEIYCIHVALFEDSSRDVALFEVSTLLPDTHRLNIVT